MIGWLIFSVVIFMAGVWVVALTGRTVSTWMGHSRCVNCHADLNTFGLSFVTRCQACGHVQPWASHA